jgi:hypothetical protein
MKKREEPAYNSFGGKQNQNKRPICSYYFKNFKETPFHERTSKKPVVIKWGFKFFFTIILLTTINISKLIIIIIIIIIRELWL